MFKKITSFIKKNVINNFIISEVKHIVIIYLFWTVLFLFVNKLYNIYCIPTTIIGYIFTSLYISSPHCKAMFYMLNTSNEMLTKMVYAFGMWIVPKLTYFKKINKEEKNLKQE